MTAIQAIAAHLRVMGLQAANHGSAALDRYNGLDKYNAQARAAGVSPELWCHWRKGRKSPSDRTLRKVLLSLREARHDLAVRTTADGCTVREVGS